MVEKGVFRRLYVCITICQRNSSFHSGIDGYLLVFYYTNKYGHNERQGRNNPYLYGFYVYFFGITSLLLCLNKEIKLVCSLNV